jgi:hypothetical protein
MPHELSPVLGGARPAPTDLVVLIANAKAGDPLSKLCLAALYTAHVQGNPANTLYDTHKHALAIQDNVADAVQL